MPGRWRMVGCGILFGFLGLATAALVARNVQEKNDPLIEGHRMSEWCFLLIEPSGYNSGYGYPSTIRKVFREHRDVAVPHLIRIVRLYSGRRNWRVKISKRV